MARGIGGAEFTLSRLKRLEREVLTAIASSAVRFTADDGTELIVRSDVAADSFLAVMGNQPSTIPLQGRLFLAQLDPSEVRSDAEQVLIRDARGDLRPDPSNPPTEGDPHAH